MAELTLEVLIKIRDDAQKALNKFQKNIKKTNKAIGVGSDNASKKATKGIEAFNKAVEKSNTAKTKATDKTNQNTAAKNKNTSATNKKSKSTQKLSTLTLKSVKALNKASASLNKSSSALLKATKNLNKNTKSTVINTKVINRNSTARKKQAKSTNLLSDRFREAARSTAILEGPLGGVSGRLSAVSASFAALNPLVVISTVLIAGFTLGLATSVKAAAKLERETFKLEAILKSTGNSAGLTVSQIDGMARSLGDLTLTSAGAARSAAAILLTFKSIRGVDFENTLTLAQDLAAVMGTDITSAALQLGKALEDPEQGLSQLRRSGVSFTDAEKDLVKAMVEVNNASGAQAFILQKIQDQLGGAGKAEAGGLSGSIDSLVERFTRLGELVSKQSGLISFLTDKFKGASRIVDRFNASFADAANKGGAELSDRLNDINKKSLALTGILKILEKADFFGSNSKAILTVKKALTALDVEFTKVQKEAAARNTDTQKATADALLKAEEAKQQKLIGLEKEALKQRLKNQAVFNTAQVQLVRDQAQVALVVLKQALDADLLSNEDFFAERLAIQTRAIDAENANLKEQLQLQNETVAKERELITAARAGDSEALTSTKALRDAEAKVLLTEQLIEKAAIKRRLAQINASLDGDKAAVQLELTLARLNRRLAESTGQEVGVDVISDQVTASFSKTIGDLEREGETGGLEIVNKLINVETAKRRIDELQNIVDLALGEVALKAAQINAAVERGTKSEFVAREEIIVLEKERAAALGETIAEMDRLALSTNNPGIIQGVQASTDSIRVLGAQATDLSKQFSQGLTGAFDDMFQSIFSGTKSALGVLEDFAQAVAQIIIRIAAQRAAAGLVSSLSGSPVPGIATGGLVLHGGVATNVYKPNSFKNGGLNKLKNYVSGGPVSGPGSGTSDSIIARISNGEFVMPTAVTKKWLPVLETMRQGKFSDWLGGQSINLPQIRVPTTPRYADGGLVDSSASTINNQGNNNGVNVTMHISTNDVGSFKRSEAQIGQKIASFVSRSNRRNV
jgi:Prophage tail length tape measure protein